MSEGGIELLSQCSCSSIEAGMTQVRLSFEVAMVLDFLIVLLGTNNPNICSGAKTV